MTWEKSYSVSQFLIEQKCHPIMIAGFYKPLAKLLVPVITTAFIPPAQLPFNSSSRE